MTSYAQTLRHNEELHADDYLSSSSRLLAANTESSGRQSASSPTVDSIAASTYSYNYNGIYIFDSRGKQVRLFDYTDGVDGSEDVIYLDVDGDGDEDIVYRMDNNLYIKENRTKDPPPRNSTETPRKMDWQDFLNLAQPTALTRSAPNFFEESFTSSNEIDFSFSPAHSDRDNLFRIEYYDYIDRFDRITAGASHSTATPTTLIHKADLIPDLPNETLTNASTPGIIQRKNIAVFRA